MFGSALCMDAEAATRAMPVKTDRIDAPVTWL